MKNKLCHKKEEITNDELEDHPISSVYIDISQGGNIDMWILLFDS